MPSLTPQDLVKGLTKMDVQRPIFTGQQGSTATSRGGGSGTDPFSSLMPMLMMKKLMQPSAQLPTTDANLLSMMSPESVASLGGGLSGMFGGSSGVLDAGTAAASGEGLLSTLASKLPEIAGGA